MRPANCKLSDLALPIVKPSRELRRLQTSKVPPGRAKTGVRSSVPIECKPVSKLEGLLSTAEVGMSLILSIPAFVGILNFDLANSIRRKDLRLS